MSKFANLLSSHWALSSSYQELATNFANNLLAGNTNKEEFAVKNKNESKELQQIPDSALGIVNVDGVLFKHSFGIHYMCMNATSYESIAYQIKSYAVDPSISAIVLNIDSPGGMVTGCMDLAENIQQYKSHKPIYSYVSGMCCSAAFWIASATDKIFAHPTAEIGSIGAICTFITRKNENEEELTFVSSVSPYKRLDPKSEEGGQEIQKRVDYMGETFLKAVAKNRRVPFKEAEKKFGQGKCFIPEEALSRNLIDEVANYKSSIESIKENVSMNLKELKEKHPDLVAQIRKEEQASIEKKIEEAFDKGKTEENGRLVPIVALGTKGKMDQQRILNAISDPEMTAEKLAYQHLMAIKDEKADEESKGQSYLNNLSKSSKKIEIETQVKPGGPQNDEPSCEDLVKEISSIGE